MKTLVHGDWVNINYKVDFPNIDKYDIDAKDQIQIKTDIIVDNLLYKNGFSISPIEITNDILIINGFEKYKDGPLTTYFRQKDNPDGTDLYDITIYKDEDEKKYKVHVTNNEPYVNVIKYISSVHELQTILRVCELDDIANNFKI
ncbi:MAG: hypothetical protein [Wendovervirus sonii]|uniref:Uncharacterized protein n=1 Tax=phage Lak_Megaphage_Sonny TaxID=3109229 RepID=A0ABZ0Z2R8_9CAUD|nr:MAG: hypothetical protein [phage Lak_Megaphage_Sonny]